MVSSARLIWFTFRDVIHVAVDLVYHRQWYMAGRASKHANRKIRGLSVLTVVSSQTLFRKQELLSLRKRLLQQCEGIWKSSGTYGEVGLGLEPFAIALPTVTPSDKFPSEGNTKQDSYDELEKSEKTHFFLSSGVRFKWFYLFAPCNRLVACLLLFQPGSM